MNRVHDADELVAIRKLSMDWYCFVKYYYSSTVFVSNDTRSFTDTIINPHFIHLFIVWS